MSVILAVRDGAPWVGQAVRSILTQTHRNLELVVVDDGSTDGTAEVVESFDDPRLRLVRKSHGGVSAARNAALDVVDPRATAIAVQDADDVSLPHRIEVQLEALENSGADYVTSGALNVRADLTPVEHVRQESVRKAHVLPRILHEGNFWVNPAVMVRRTSLGALRYDESLTIGEDVTLLSQVARLGHGVHLPDALILYRLHATSASHAEPAEENLRWRRAFLAAHPVEALVPEAFNAWEPVAAGAVATAEVALAHARLGHLADAHSRFTSAAAACPPSAEQHLTGLLHLAVGDLHGAEAALRQSPEWALSRAHLGEIAAQTGRAGEALQHWTEALGLDPSCFVAARSLQRLRLAEAR